MEALTKTRSVGGSIMITIPKAIIESENITPNEFVKVEIKKLKKSWRGALKGVGVFTQEDKFDTDTDE